MLSILSLFLTACHKTEETQPKTEKTEQKEKENSRKDCIIFNSGNMLCPDDYQKKESQELNMAPQASLTQTYASKIWQNP